jgi:eukaryotic-like serine/threonine-protein kinase
VLQPLQIFAARYRVIRHLADGGMGAVYEAEHTATEARVALKLLWPHVVQIASARERFELEARISARINDEHIVKVLDAGFDPETRAPYLVMELLRGRTLGALVSAEGPLPPALALAVMRQVAAGLDAAHGYRTADGVPTPIVHRDLKPENLFLTQRADGSPWVKILDFGIAKVLGDATAVSREIRGTPLYMAFEQAAGEPVTPQTDVWAFGLISYYLLTGRRYWPAANRPEGGLPALFAEILNLPLPVPSERMRQDGVPLVLSSTFDAWLLRCLDRDARQRFASAGEAWVALERALGAGAGRAAEPRAAAHARVRADAIPLVTATYVPAAVVDRRGMSQSLPPVESERLRSTSVWNRKSQVLYGLGLGFLGVSGLGLWLLAQDEDPLVEGIPAAAPTAPATPAPVTAVVPLEPLPAPRAAAPEPPPPNPPQVGVRPVRDDETARRPLVPEPTPPAPPPPAREPSAATPAAVVPPESRTVRESPKPAKASEPCKFDPYTGRCVPPPTKTPP